MRWDHHVESTITLPKTNIATENPQINGWKMIFFLLGQANGLLSGAFAVSFRECHIKNFTVEVAKLI